MRVDLLSRVFLPCPNRQLTDSLSAPMALSKQPSTLYEARRSGASAGPSGARSLRMPFGVLLVALVCLVGGGYALWSLGYQAGLRSLDQQRADAALVTARTADPLMPPAAVSPAMAPEVQGAPRFAPALSGLGPAPEGDPRRAGFNYFILADGISLDRASEMVAFCRGQGLDAIAVPSNNARFLVFVQPGFGWDDRGGPAVKALEVDIRSVGAKWKALGRGNGDFRDFYPKLFKGPT